MEIRVARPGDLRFILQMQAAESNALGFVPRNRLELEIHRRRILVATAGRLQLGYAYLGSARSNTLPIYQCVTEPGVRRREIGQAFVAQASLVAAVSGATALRCHCREELEANAFWSAIGFELQGTSRRGRARGKRLNAWRLSLLRVTRSDYKANHMTAARAGGVQDCRAVV